MLWIYLPSSTDLKLCSNVPIIHFVNTWTFLTVFTSRNLGPNIWERSKIDWFTFFGLLPGRAISISWILLVYFFWFTSREVSTNWLWFTLVYLQTIDGLLIFAILLVYSGLLGFEIYFLDMSEIHCIKNAKNQKSTFDLRWAMHSVEIWQTIIFFIWYSLGLVSIIVMYVYCKDFSFLWGKAQKFTNTTQHYCSIFSTLPFHVLNPDCILRFYQVETIERCWKSIKALRWMVASRSFASINHGHKKFVSGQFFCLISIFEIL